MQTKQASEYMVEREYLARFSIAELVGRIIQSHLEENVTENSDGRQHRKSCMEEDIW